MQESLNASLVRIRAADGRVVGAGFLVGQRHILTCAHVISQALNLPDTPADPPQERVSLDFPLIPPRTLLTASVVQWSPPQSDGRGDIAGLELPSDPPAAAEVVRIAPVEDLWEHPFRAFGFPAGYDDGVWATGRLLGRQATDWVMIEDIKAQGHPVAPGFSGTPVWDTRMQGVVGMVVAASSLTDLKTAFVLPLDVLATTWPLLTVPHGQPRNPYKGLRPFTQHDATDFFGREAVVEKLTELVSSLVTDQPARSSTRLLTILGPSGAGKSSLVMAGLLPKLRKGILPGSDTWLYLDPIVSGKHPIEALASTLKPHFPDTSFKTLLEDLENDAARGLHLLATQLAKQPGTNVVLLIDQFEELFTQTESADERQRFIRLLLTACNEPRGPLLVLLTLRADFYDRPMQYPDLFRVIDNQHLSLLAVEPGDLRRVIEQPAALPDVQVTFEGDLVNRLLADVQGQVGALPLLQFTLDQLFQRRSSRQLTLSSYREIGGVKGALTKQAEETYTTLPSDEHRKLARALFVRLIDPGATEQDTTRRRAALSEFTLTDSTQTRLMRETIDAFIKARLLTTNEIAGPDPAHSKLATIEVSHEALIREWPRLAEWMREARQDIPLQQTISKDATEWEQRNKPGDRLYRGSQLKEARTWAQRNILSSNEAAFLHAGAVQRVRSIGRMTAIALVLLLLIGLAGGLYYHIATIHIPLDPTRVTNLQDDGTGSLRYAVNDAPSGSTIRFDAGLHGTILLSSGDLIIARNLTIRGPGAGILSISSGKTGHIVHVLSGTTVAISGLTFKNSETQNSFIYNEGTLKLSNSIVSGNTVTGRYQNGGGISNFGTLTLSNSIVSGNTATSGGGISNAGIVGQVGGTLTLTNSIVSGNTAFDGGGGIESDHGTLTLTNSIISGNTLTTGYNGGGIDTTDDLVTLSNSTVSNNRAYDGGGINSAGSVVTLSNSTISVNTATDAGGGINNFGMLTLSNSTVSDNKASQYGGGIFSNGTLALSNSTISGNTAKYAGGFAIFDTPYGTKVPVQVMLFYCTVYNNTASVSGGILVDTVDKQSQVTMGASIVAGNRAHTSPDIVGRLTTLGYNLVGDRSGATFLGPPKVQSTDMLGASSTALGIDPMLRDNGGSAKPHTWTLALLPGSPAIDRIPLQYCQVKDILNSRSRMYTDQRGMKRPDENESACDIGAYESSP